MWRLKLGNQLFMRHYKIFVRHAIQVLIKLYFGDTTEIQEKMFSCVHKIPQHLLILYKKKVKQL